MRAIGLNLPHYSAARHATILKQQISLRIDEMDFRICHKFMTEKYL